MNGFCGIYLRLYALLLFYLLIPVADSSIFIRMEAYGLIGLFVSALISSTLLPGGSEVVLLYLATQTTENHGVLWLVSTLGNSLGGISTWFIGWWIAHRFPTKSLDEKKHAQALNRVRRWGSPGLLLSWVPIIGDPLCFVAGWLKLSFFYCALFIILGKAVRYGVLLLAV